MAVTDYALTCQAGVLCYKGVTIPPILVLRINRSELNFHDK